MATTPMNTKDRVKKFLQDSEINISEFYKKTGLSNGFLNSGKGIGSEKIEIIISCYPELDVYWLIMGKPNPLQNERDNFYTTKKGPKKGPIEGPNIDSLQNEKYIFEGFENKITVVPTKAVAGYLDGYREDTFLEGLPCFALPNLPAGDYRAFEVSGYSMYNTFYPGDYIICKRQEDWESIANDKVYVINSKLGIIIKRVINKLATNGHLILKSDNYADNKFPDMVLEREEIVEVWYAKAFVSQQMPGNKYLYSMINDLRGRVAEIEAKSKD